MDIATQEMLGAAKSVRAKINYSVPMDRRPFIVNHDFSQNDLLVVSVEMPIFDAGTLATTPRLDAEGFALVSSEVDIADLAESVEAGARYRADLVPLMLQLTGADEIDMHPICVIRRQLPSGVGLAEGGLAGTTVDFVHSDFTESGAEQQRMHYAPPSRPGVRRTAFYNMWRLLSKGPTNRPLALCDARSVSAADVIAGDSRLPDNSFFETAFLRHNSSHRWVYFPQLTSDELLVFKQADSDPGYPRLVPHTAFDDDSCRPDADPRISIETRCMAIWYN